MSHLRPDVKARRHKASWCKKGRHNFGEAQHIGAGISRQVCLTCGVVTIDLTEAEWAGQPREGGAPAAL